MKKLTPTQTRALRKAAGFKTCKAAAFVIDVHPTAWQKWEQDSNARRMNLANAESFAARTGISDAAFNQILVESGER